MPDDCTRKGRNSNCTDTKIKKNSNVKCDPKCFLYEKTVGRATVLLKKGAISIERTISKYLFLPYHEF